MAAEEVVVEAIFRAAREGDVDIVAGMLDEEPGLLSSVSNNGTLLTTAVRNDHVDLVRLLLERGTDINQGNAHGSTALHLAIFRGHEEMVSMLLSSGADISRKAHWGKTALMHASLGGHVAMVWLLLRSIGRGGLDERDEHARTALWYACFYGHADVVRALLLAGADHTIADNDDRTPLQITQEKEHHECVGVFQWFEGELQRAYVLHKARTLHEDTATRQQAPAAPVPAYLTARVTPGSMLPSVQVVAIDQAGKEGAAKREREEKEEEEEVCATVGYVVRDLDGHLYTELLEGLKLR